MPLPSDPPYRARTFLPRDLDASDWSRLEPLYAALEAREITSPAELEAWLADVDEITSVVGEQGARRYIAMTCDTTDEAVGSAYASFAAEVEPRVESKAQRLKRKYLASPHRHGIDRGRTALLEKLWESSVALHREENLPLMTESSVLDQEHDKIAGARAVVLDGEELTFPQATRRLEDPDESVRRKAFVALEARRAEDRETLDDLYDRMLSVRARMAANAGLASFREFTWQARARFDYTPDDCFAFHRAVETAVVPLRDRLDEVRARELGVARLRPWDLQVDPGATRPLAPFNNIDELCDGVGSILERVSPPFGAEFDKLRTRGALDLDSRKGKAGGGYQYTLAEAREPFIFMNAAGAQGDVMTLLHESGHALHAVLSRDQPYQSYREPCLEFAEVASMSMEHIGRAHLDAFYSPEDAKRAARSHLEDVIRLLPWIATVDAFQHWVYTHPGHSRTDRRDAWEGLMTRFFSKIDWTGFDEARGWWWQRQRHIFGAPFYYIEYGIAQLGALQIWLNVKRDSEAAIEAYRSALVLGGSRSLPELFAAAGARFDMSEATVTPLVEAVTAELAS